MIIYFYEIIFIRETDCEKNEKKKEMMRERSVWKFKISFSCKIILYIYYIYVVIYVIFISFLHTKSKGLFHVYLFYNFLIIHSYLLIILVIFPHYCARTMYIHINNNTHKKPSLKILLIFIVFNNFTILIHIMGFVCLC